MSDTLGEQISQRDVEIHFAEEMDVKMEGHVQDILSKTVFYKRNSEEIKQVLCSMTLTFSA